MIAEMHSGSSKFRSSRNLGYKEIAAECRGHSAAKRAVGNLLDALEIGGANTQQYRGTRDLSGFHRISVNF